MVTFFSEVPDWEFPLKDDEILSWILKLSRLEKKEIVDINYKFVTDNQLLQMNKVFLNHNYYTDVITFSNNRGGRISGDIAISIDRIYDQSKDLKIEFLDELKRVMIHGILHICGYQDSSEEEKKQMREKENYYLSIYPTR